MSDFETFWKAYPRRVCKGAARKAYEKALTLVDESEIMEGLQRFIVAKPWDGNIRFCPHPSTWLNQERWADEYESESDVQFMSYEERREYSRRLIAEQSNRLKVVK